jgi:hypothetical protein
MLDSRFELPVQLMKQQLEDLGTALEVLKSHLETTNQTQQQKEDTFSSVQVAQLQAEIGLYLVLFSLSTFLSQSPR